MIKLKSLMEVTDSQRPDPSLDKYLLDNAVVDISEYLYHGSPFDGLVSMLVRGIGGTQHGEVAEYDSFSTSLNSEMLHHFSEGNGETGLQFKVENAKVVVLDDMMTYLVTQLAGSGFNPEIDDVAKFEEFCQRFKIPDNQNGRGPYLPYNYLSSLGVDAFMFDYVWQRLRSGYSNPHNDESEICFIGQGIPKLDKMIETIYVDGEEFDKKLPALRAIKKKMHEKT